MIDSRLPSRVVAQRALALAFFVALVASGLSACDAIPGASSGAALARKGNAKACTHRDTLSLVEMIVRGHPNREPSDEEISALPILFSNTVMVQTDKGVSVTCQTLVSTGDQVSGDLAYKILPAADGSADLVIQLNRSEQPGIDAYIAARAQWEQDQPSNRAGEPHTATLRTPTARLPTTTPDVTPAGGPSGFVSGECNLIYLGHQIMSGACSGLADAIHAFVTAEESGCSIYLDYTTNAGAMTKLSAYRNTCWIDEGANLQIEHDVDLGMFYHRDGCWVGNAGRVCIQPTE